MTSKNIYLAILITTPTTITQADRYYHLSHCNRSILTYMFTLYNYSAYVVHKFVSIAKSVANLNEFMALLKKINLSENQ